MVSNPEENQPERFHSVQAQISDPETPHAPAGGARIARMGRTPWWPPFQMNRSIAPQPGKQIRNRDIDSYLRAQTGMLRVFMHRNRSVRRLLLRFITGKQRVLIVGGEPGNGKSLFTGELIVRCRELANAFPDLSLPLALVSYDRVHSLFFERLSSIVGSTISLPAGETHPAARQHVSEVMCEVMLFAILHLPPGTRILMEAPLIDHRGDIVVDNLPRWGYPVQIVIMHSPQMWTRVLAAAERISEKSAQRLAMLQIRTALIHQRVGRHVPSDEQGRAIQTAWKRWLSGRDGVVISWDPARNEQSFEQTTQLLTAEQVSPDQMFPTVLDAHAIRVTDSVLESLPDLRSFAEEMRTYKGTPID